MSHDRQQDDNSHSPRNTFNQGLSLSLIHITPIIMLLRKPSSIGARYYGMETFWAFLYMPVFGAVLSGNTGEGLPLFMLFWVIYIALLAIHRGSSDKKAAQGDTGHTRYIGDSWLTGWSAAKDELITKKNNEPAACLVLGLCCIPFSFPLGMYFIIGAFLLPIPIWAAERREKVQRMDWQDARLENERFSRWIQEQQDRYSNER